MSTYVVGDIQGCYAELMSLLEKIQFNESSDVLWCVGDLVNRGPASLETLRFLKNFSGRLHCVLGNHDLHLLAATVGARAPKSSDTLIEILQAPDRIELCDWLRHLPLLHFDAKLNTVMTHAGLYPFWTFDEARQRAKEVEAALQGSEHALLLSHMYGNVPGYWGEALSVPERLRFIINAFTRMRVLNADNSLNLVFDSTLEAMPRGCVPWFDKLSPEYERKRVVFGHWAALRGVTHQANVDALDTGCVWGGALTALRLEDGQRFSVASIKPSLHP